MVNQPKDGGDLKWRNFQKQAGQVKDGMLMVEYSGKGEAGNGGDIITEEQFGDFELKT